MWRCFYSSMFVFIIAANSDILYDMVGKIMKPNVGLVHQMPFTTDHIGFAAAIEKVSFFF